MCGEDNGIGSKPNGMTEYGVLIDVLRTPLTLPGVDVRCG